MSTGDRTIASGALWCVAGIAALTRGTEINAQATRAGSAQTVLIKTAQAPPETDRGPAFSERWGVTTSKFKAQNFGEEVCVRWRQLDRGMPGGGSEVLWSPCRAADARTSQGTVRPFQRSVASPVDFNTIGKTVAHTKLVQLQKIRSQ